MIALLVLHVGLDELGSLARDLGWSLVPLALLPGALTHAAFLAGWWLAFPDAERRPGILTLGRCYLPGEALNVLTGLAQMGGEPLKAYLLRGETGWSLGLASVISARTLRIVAQLLFLLIGLAFAVLTLDLPAPLEVGLVAGAVLLGAGVGVFFFLQQRGLLSQALKILDRFGIAAARRHQAGAREVDAALRESYRGRGARVPMSILVQLVGFLGGVVEVYFLFRLLGVPLDLADAFAAESLAFTLTTLAFFAPAGLGVNEGGRILVFGLLGHAPALGLASGLLRRLRELLWAGLGLLVNAGAGRGDGRQAPTAI